MASTQSLQLLLVLFGLLLAVSCAEHSSVPTATTQLPVTTGTAQTTGLANTSGSSTNQPHSTLLPITTPALTSHGDQTSPRPTSPSVSTVNSTTDSTAHEDIETGLSSSETAMTIFFGVALGLAVLTAMAYSLGMCKRRATQFSHRRLHNSAEDTGDRFGAPDDTLVISGGLYDGPQVFNPVEEDVGLHCDRPAPGSGATQLRLEFLPDDQEKPLEEQA
ncbi:hypothetical protein AAFF_G00271190 [Aldrovandia affinis]|uniref:Uncharacterized protein n=1 Tax=Aldrovandia affinis TaxID=143900 RepID=A0AAD7W2S1_9TELE|nr:hypothetical protein AAFF_G00271190 [Aldrovandia affinis]